MKIQVFEYFEWAALLSCIILFKKIKSTPFKILIPYLCFVVLIESGNHFGFFFLKTHKTNNWIYNIFLFLEYTTFLTLLFKNRYLRREKIFYLILLIGFFLFHLINLFFIQKLWKLNTYSIIFISIVMIVSSLVLLFKSLLSNESDFILKNEYFWLCISLLFFYILETLLYAVFPHFAYSNPIVFIKIFSNITNVAIISLYSLLIITLTTLWKFPKTLY